VWFEKMFSESMILPANFPTYLLASLAARNPPKQTLSKIVVDHANIGSDHY